MITSNYAPVVKWISYPPSKRSLQVRLLPGAQRALIVQWIGHKIPDLVIEVRFLMRAQFYGKTN